MSDLSQLALDRLAYKRSKARRSTVIAAVSTVVFAAIAYFGLTNSPGWPRVQSSFFNWDTAVHSFPAVLSGLWLNIRVLVVCEIAVLAFALLIAAGRSLRGPVWLPVRLLATGYVDLFRGMPLIIVLYLVGFGLPALRLQGIPTDPVVLGGIALVLTYSAYVAEVFRAGIESIHPSQVAAARSIGLTHAKTMRIVLLPQAIRRVVPPLLNDFVSLQKDCGLISVLGAIDAVRAAQIATAEYYDFTPYVVAAVLFVLLAVPVARLADWTTKRIADKQGASA